MPRLSAEGLALREYAMALDAGAPRQRSNLLVSTAAGGPAYPVTVLGNLGDGRTLMISAPATPDKALVAVLKGQALNCRWLNASSAFRFRATILRLAFEPVPIVYLEVPPAVEKLPLRSQPRVSTSVFGRFKAARHSCESLLVDLSVGGARIALAGGAEFSVGMEAELLFRVTLLESDYLVQLKCSVKGALGFSEPRHPQVAFYGVDFMDISQIDLLVLHAYVQERLAFGLDGVSQLLERRIQG
jgi:c-di-GMP-binding flagellar brake protein YcgR